MHGYFNTKDKELTYTERQLIECWYNKDKLSNRQIAHVENLFLGGSKTDFVL
ncbi:MAG TPA: hypothetical protein VGC17_02970 [Lactovum miscens]